VLRSGLGLKGVSASVRSLTLPAQPLQSPMTDQVRQQIGPLQGHFPTSSGFQPLTAVQINVWLSGRFKQALIVARIQVLVRWHRHRRNADIPAKPRASSVAVKVCVSGTRRGHRLTLNSHGITSDAPNARIWLTRAAGLCAAFTIRQPTATLAGGGSQSGSSWLAVFGSHRKLLGAAPGSARWQLTVLRNSRLHSNHLHIKEAAARLSFLHLTLSAGTSSSWWLSLNPIIAVRFLLRIVLTQGQFGTQWLS
jgi:hypothetical protein